MLLILIKKYLYFCLTTTTSTSKKKYEKEENNYFVKINFLIYRKIGESESEQKKKNEEETQLKIMKGNMKKKKVTKIKKYPPIKKPTKKKNTNLKIYFNY